jgi:hypothetical protein
MIPDSPLEKQLPNVHVFSFDHLSSVEFENLAYDLLDSMGFVNISWRKGTALNASPSDSGRDIECERQVVEVDRSTYLERWFVECKHYQKGVPPEKLQSAIAWANAEQPDKLLIICSGFLSNPAKDYLVNFEKNNRPKYKIIYWEYPKLESLLISRSILQNKYKLFEEPLALKFIHPVHLMYILKPPMNSLDTFFKILDQQDAEFRDHISSWLSHSLINPKYRKPVTGNEKIKDLQINDTSYPVIKSVCYHLADDLGMADFFLVTAMVNFILSWQLRISDITEIDIVQRNMVHAVRFFEARLVDEPENKALLSAIEMGKERIQKAEESTKKQYDDYQRFCMEVVAELFNEEQRHYDTPGAPIINVTAWNNGMHMSTGAGYGIKIPLNDRDKYFKKDWKGVIIYLGNMENLIRVNIDKPSFWGNSCRELISVEIGKWLIENKLAPWGKGHPPKLQLIYLGFPDKNFFLLMPFDEEDG